MAVWIPASRQPDSRAAANDDCRVTSPPVRVTPPPEWAKNGFMRIACSTNSSTPIRLPLIASAPLGQCSVHFPQVRQANQLIACPPFTWCTCWGQTEAHAPQSAHRSCTNVNSGSVRRDSGLWHQLQESGQPFR